MRWIHLAFVSAVTCMIAKPALGCSGEEPSLQAAYDWAAVVFDGTATRIGPEFEPHMFLVEFRIRASAKRPLPTVVNIVTGDASGNCGYPFVVGSRYFVFAYPYMGEVYATGMFTGTHAVGADAVFPFPPVSIQAATWTMVRALYK